MFRIRFEVDPDDFHCPIKSKIWATLSSWEEDNGVKFETVVLKVCDVETLARGANYPKMSQKCCVEVVLVNHTAEVGEAQESAEKLAEMLGLEFGLVDAPRVGFEVDKS